MTMIKNFRKFKKEVQKSRTGLVVYTTPAALEWASKNEKVDRHWTGLFTGMGRYIPVPVYIIPMEFQCWFRSMDSNATEIM